MFIRRSGDINPKASADVNNYHITVNPTPPPPDPPPPQSQQLVDWVQILINERELTYGGPTSTTATFDIDLPPGQFTLLASHGFATFPFMNLLQPSLITLWSPDFFPAGSSAIWQVEYNFSVNLIETNTPGDAALGTMVYFNQKAADGTTLASRQALQASPINPSNAPDPWVVNLWISGAAIINVEAPAPYVQFEVTLYTNGPLLEGGTTKWTLGGGSRIRATCLGISNDPLPS